jgi:hypothetical protein
VFFKTVLATVTVNGETFTCQPERCWIAEEGIDCVSPFYEKGVTHWCVVLLRQHARKKLPSQMEHLLQDALSASPYFPLYPYWVSRPEENLPMCHVSVFRVYGHWRYWQLEIAVTEYLRDQDPPECCVPCASPSATVE